MICINQANVKERGQQVQIMCDIYHQAQRVMIYFGEAGKDSDAIMDTIPDLGHRLRMLPIGFQFTPLDFAALGLPEF